MVRPLRWRTGIVLCALLVPVISGLSSPVANAVVPGSVGAATASSWQSNATVWKMAYGHGDVWMIGDFTALRPPGAALGTQEQPAAYFAALDAATGTPATGIDDTHTFTGQPAGTLPLTDGAVAVSPDGNTVYVGGTFTAVDGQPRDHVAAFNAADGSLTAWQPQVSGKVAAIATYGNVVYLGGFFDKVDGSDEANLAAVSATDGSLLAWGSGTQPNTDREVHALAVTPDGSQVVAAGYFDQVDGLSQSADGTTLYNKAAIIGGIGSSTPGALEPMPADRIVPVGNDDNKKGCGSDVKDVVISAGVAYFANEGTGAGCFDGTWAANLSTGKLVWVNRCLGATQVIEVVGNYLYKGSHAHDCASRNTNGDPANFPQVAKGDARHLLSESISNGFLGPWYPLSNAGVNLGPRAMATDGSQLYVGGDFTTINHVGQQGIARFTPTSNYRTPQPAAPTVASTRTGAVTITAVPPVDLDNPALAMELFRGDGTTPIATTNVTSYFWKQPTVRWVERGLRANTHPTYRVKAVQRPGTGASALSDPTEVKVDCAQPSQVRAAIVKVSVKRGPDRSRHVRIEVCSATAMRMAFTVRRGHHVLSSRSEHYFAAGSRVVSLSIHKHVHRGPIKAFATFSRHAHHRVIDRKVYLPR